MRESDQIYNSFLTTLDTLPLRYGTTYADLFRLRGLMAGEVYDRNGEVYELGQEAGGDLDEWDNVPLHCITVALVADILGEAAGLDEQTRITLNTAALLHDSDKKGERNWQRTIEDKKITRKTKQTLRKIAASDLTDAEDFENAQLGIPEEVNALMKAVNVPSVDGQAIAHPSRSQRIMWLADACVSRTSIVSVDERMSNSENHPKNGANNRVYSEMFRTQYGKPLYQVQREIGRQYVTEFMPLIDAENYDHFFAILAARVEQRIKQGILPTVITI